MATAPIAPRHGWWRRNALALAGVAVLLPATFGIIGWNEWNEYFSSRPTQPVTAAAGASVEFEGATWGPAKVETAPRGAELEVPDGSRVLMVSVPVEPGGDKVTCLPPTLRETTGAEREWQAAGFEIGWDPEPEQFGSCAGTGADPFTITAAFLVPDDTVGPFAVDLVSDVLPRFLRLLVEP